MFCAPEPCSCVAKPKTVKRATRLKPAPVQVVKPDLGSAMRSKVKTEDTELSGCVRTLESILHPEELEKYSHMLGSATDRAERWKARNGSTYS